MTPREKVFSDFSIPGFPCIIYFQVKDLKQHQYQAFKRLNFIKIDFENYESQKRRCRLLINALILRQRKPRLKGQDVCA